MTCTLFQTSDSDSVQGISIIRFQAWIVQISDLPRPSTSRIHVNSKILSFTSIHSVIILYIRYLYRLLRLCHITLMTIDL